MMRRDEATERQVQAASPQTSTWLSANAGSGKTRVLTDRVARLLLEGVSPQHILCLTYTKAAASEMQNRLFKRLGTWAMQDADLLAKELAELGVDGGISQQELEKARTLFALAIETPGGLKIQTIHSFCASVLRRFPLESGVSPQFTEMDDRTAKLLRSEIVEEMASGQDAAIINQLAAFYTDSNFDKLTAEVCKHRGFFQTGIKPDKLWELFDLKPGLNKQDILSNVFLGSEATLLTGLLAALKNGSSNDLKAAAKISELDFDNLGFESLKTLESVFLFGSGAKAPFAAKIDSFPTQKTRISLGALIDPINSFMLRVEEARNNRIGLYSAEKSLSLYNFAEVFLPLYETRKQQKGWLDFDDLIINTAKLLNDQTVAQWVLFRLDGGIDHILVDEAQDTSPAQWNVIERLSQEFTSGEGAHSDKLRTLFVVGDKKQSIYSFQGADPNEFERMKQHFSSKLSNANKPFNSLQLTHSFRSANPIMRLVDLTFQDRGEIGLGSDIKHIAFKENMPGRVDLWPLVEKPQAAEDKEWFDPTDKLASNHETVVLADNIADHIQQLCSSGQLIPEEIDNSGQYQMRPVTEGDFLILVRRRPGLFHEIIRACKSAGLSIAGADRLKIGAELAVKDLTALLSFLATPEDDLSLASALRSPLFGWSEQDLFNLAHYRKKGSYLWAALRNRKEEFHSTMEVLNALRKQADFLRPYELLERILTRFKGRKNLLARLGEEAEDGIDALLTQAMNYERMDIPSLTGFITWLQAEEVEIKRQLDGAGDQIRVMTVHGAKGLESPIVILPDTAEWRRDIKDQLYPYGKNIIWRTTSDERPKLTADAHNQLLANQDQERMRLLYVAMTRAEKWLIVCGAGDLAKDSQSWHSLIENGMNTVGAEQCDFITGRGLRFQSGNWDAPVIATKDKDKASLPDLPDWVFTQAATPQRPLNTISPSNLGGAKALVGNTAGLTEDQAKLRGSQIHLLLEHLPNFPQTEWPDVAKSLLSNLAQNAFDDAYGEVYKVLTNPDLAHIFSSGALSEVPVSAKLEVFGGRRIYGKIDKLIISENSVLAIDYKSNTEIPKSCSDIPDGILRQLGAYSAALEMIYPNHEINTAILWTANASLMPVKPETVSNALLCIQSLDLGDSAT